MLVRKIKDGVWEIEAEDKKPGFYDSREAAIRAIDLTDDERWQVMATASARDAQNRLVTYDDVMWVIAARPRPPR